MTEVDAADRRGRPRTKLVVRVAAAVAVVVSTAAAVPVVAARDAAAATAYYVAPDGNDSAAGTQAAPWASISRAQTAARAGDTVYLRGGTYAFTRANSGCSSQTARVDAVTLNKSGSSGSPIRYWAYPGEKPVFDFSRMTDNCRIKGFNVTGSFLHLRGLEARGVPQNNTLNAESWGIWVSGSNNTFELIDTHHHMGTGLFINGGAGNLVLNSDSHDNYDRNSSDGPGENADGFGAHYTPAGRPANVFRGCRAWWNADDGYDLISTYSPVTIENSWSWRNGYVPGTTTPSGNGVGFKVGGFGAEYDPGAVKHTVRFSVAFLNKAAGFYSNHHPVANDYVNNTSYGNRPDFNMLGIDSNGGAVGRGNLRNNIAYTGTLTSNMTGTTGSHNSWDLGLTLSDSQFQSVSTAGWDAPRQTDGSLPVLPHLRLAANSILTDRGTDVGLPYAGRAPDLGAFEFGVAPTSPPTTRPPTTAPPTTAPPTATPPSGGCGGAYRTVTSWSGGYQGEVTVTAGGSAINGWTVGWTVSSGQTLTQVWNGTPDTSGSTVSVSNAPYNGTLPPSGSTTFGFTATGAPPTMAFTCTGR